MENATAVEIVWTFVAVTGLLVSLRGGWKAHGDLSYLKKRELNGQRKIIARGHFRREMLRVSTHTAFGAAGVAAMFRPATPGAPPVSMIILLLIFGEVCVVLAALSDQYTTKSAIEHWKTIDLRHLTEREKEIDRLAKDQRASLAENARYNKATSESLARIEQAGAKAVVAAERVAEELAESQGRADEIHGVPGESADAASRSRKEEE